MNRLDLGRSHPDTKHLSRKNKLEMISAAFAYFLTSCATPPTPATSVICPDTTDPMHQSLLKFEFSRLPPNKDGTIKIDYDITPIPGDGSTNYAPPRRFSRPGNVPTEGVDIDIPFALVTNPKTGKQDIATVNLSECVTSDPEKLKKLFDGITPDQVSPRQRASFNGKDWEYSEGAKALRERVINPSKGQIRLPRF